MKKIFIILTFALCLIFTLTIVSMAQEMENCYYVVQNEDSDVALTLVSEGKSIIGIEKLYSTKGDTSCFLYQFENSTLNLILAENVSYCMNPNPSNPWGSGIRLDMAISLNVYFNGYYWWIPDDNRYAGFFINHQDAHLSLIGNRTLEEVSGEFNLSSVNANTKSSSVDYYGGYIGFYVEKGDLTIKNAIVIGEDELIYQKDNNASGTTTLEFDTCLLNNKDKSCRTIVFKSAGHTDITVKMNHVYTDRVEINNVAEDSYINNSKMSLLYTDSWHGDNLIGKDYIYINNSIITEYKAVGDTQHIVATNCTFNKIDLVGDSTGGGFATLIDSTYSTLNLKRNTSKTTRNGVLNMITSPDCVNAGTKTVYNYDDATSSIVSTVDEEYSKENGALGHDTNGGLISITYTGYDKYGDGEYVCSVCNANHTVIGAIDPIFKCSGFSIPENGRKEITVGFEINKVSLTEYETLMNKSISYGVFAASKQVLGTNDILQENGEATQGVIKADINDTKVIFFELRLSGFNTENQLNALLILGAFVKVTDEDSIEYSYMQPINASEGEKYGSISFNELLNQ